MRKGTIIAAVGFVLVSAWLIVPRAREARREAAYGAALAPFQRDLPIGNRQDTRKPW